MMSVVDVALTLGLLVLLVPSAVLFVECAAALLASRKPPWRARLSSDPRVVVMVPAHDERKLISSSLEGMKSELGPGDRLLVVADNCSDRTAEIARAVGAEVIERFDPVHRGKGVALDFGIAHLASDPPDVVVIVDADCHVAPGSIRRLAECATLHHRPAQAQDLLTVPRGAAPLAAVSALAFLVRNHVRPTGLRQLGLPCHLMGTGMAFPWDVIRSAPPAGSHLAEDIQMGIELASLGFPPVYCATARITSAPPKRTEAVRGQRRRWEHGHISTLIHRAPQLIWRGLTRRRLPLLTMALDLVVPPLALLVTLLILGTGLTFLWWRLGGSSLPLAVSMIEFGLVGTAVFSAWLKYGRQTLPARYLLMIPFYVVWKLPLYLSFVTRGPAHNWERAERSASGF